MVRTLKTATRIPKGERTLLLPGATGAEPWELWAAGKAPRCLHAFGADEGPTAGRDAVLALPVAEVTALPLWLQETRQDELRGMVDLQIEAQGLRSRGQDAVFAYTIVAQEEKRTLVLVGVLAAALPPEIEAAASGGFDLSARCWPLPADALVFWLEQDRLVLAASRGERLAYFQTLTDATFSPRVVQEITCILASLRMQGVIAKPTRAVFWADRVPEGTSEFGAALGLALEHEARPGPRVPDERWLLMPHRVAAAARARQSRRWRGRGLVLVLLLALLVLAGMGLRFTLLARDVARLHQWQSTHADDLALVHDTSTSWRDLQPALDPKQYPLEVLLHVSEALPGDAHLTLFDLEGHHLLLRAEAKNLTAAFDFFDHLKKSVPLAGFTWEMAQPHLLNNDVTQIQVEGDRAGSN